MALKYILTLGFILSTLLFLAQEEDYVNDRVLKYDDYVYKPNIKTVQFHEVSWEFTAPIIKLNSNEQLQLDFDDLNGDKKLYTMTFVHCNADWTPSDLMVSEYLTGFYDLNLLNYNYAVNTAQKYTHYTIIFPMAGTQQNTQFTKSGNYVMYVYEEGNTNDIVLSRRFMVYDNRVSVTSTLKQPIGGGQQYNKQQIDFTISAAGYNMTNSYKDMKVVLIQNNRWDNAVTGIQPTFMNGSQFIYSLDEASTFNGGNEFRYFDIRSVRFLTEKVQNIYRDENDQYKVHAVLYADESRALKPYLFYNDFNGNFLIKNRETVIDNDVEGDYVFVDFFLTFPKPISTGNVYIMGKLTDWRMNRNSKMTYNYERFGYQARLRLKQGYYNYIYVISDDTKKGGDEAAIEGNHWDTENDYFILVYHRKFGTYYDQLIGYQKMNSMKK
ncbi:DUF5103 domain-containing protein [Aurantibacillus circumpalustris]|uniref:type IX secretion system plug protein n=1 Tax=Aurantibacillus circumpalustris TaxID=3036359 RepID=UPI00295C37DD|nr:DUF5103 domain-containing protein [Aurantibacillus circumpalustris]